MTVAVILLAFAVGFLTLLVFGLLRTYAEIIRALNRAGIRLDDSVDSATQSDNRTDAGRGDHLPGVVRDIVGISPAGGLTKVSVSDVGHLTLLAFLSSGCRTCEKFWGALADPDLKLPDPDTRLVIVGQDPAYESQSDFAELVPTGVKAVMSSAAWQAYDVPGSPYFALVDGAADRLVGAGTAASWEQMRTLLRQALSDDARIPHGRGRRFSSRNREQRADDALRSAGIGPDHPSVDLARDENGFPDRRLPPEP